MNGTPIHLFQQNDTKRNGRIDIMDNKEAERFPLYENKKKNTEYKNEALKGIQISSPLSKLFFSEKNINDIQNMIRYNVWLKSNKEHIIGRQSDIDLHIVMRSFYLQYAQHQQVNITNQIKELNTLVLNWVIPKILTQIKQYIVYKQQVSGIYEPIDREINTSVSGTKTLELKTFF